MQMTPSEIIVRYRQAKDKTEQIKILADLNACTTDKIINTIVEHSNGEYKLSYFNRLNHKLKKQKKNEQNRTEQDRTEQNRTEQDKVEYKKPEIITEKKAVELEKSAAEELEKQREVAFASLITSAEIATEKFKELSDNSFKIISDEEEKVVELEESAADKKLCKDCDVYDKILQRCKIGNSGYSPGHVCDVSEEEIEAIKPLLATDSENLDVAIEIISQEIKRIDTEIARLKGLKEEILTRCEGAVPF